MNEQSEIDRATENGRLDLIKGNRDGNEIGLIKLEREVRRGEWAGNGDPFSANSLARVRLERDEPRAVFVAHRGTVREQGVTIGEIGVGVNRDCGDLELP